MTASGTAAVNRAPRQRARLVLVTGMSGAGKTTVLKALEDIGYEAVDNLPLSLLASLLHPAAKQSEALAIDIDIRTRDFAPATTSTRGCCSSIATTRCCASAIPRRAAGTRWPRTVR